MNIYFLIYVMLDVLALGIHLAKHGENKDGEYNFITSLISTIITISLVYMAIKVGF